MGDHKLPPADWGKVQHIPRTDPTACEKGFKYTHLPGRSNARSRMSGRLVPAKTTTPVVLAKPSISTSSWLSVFSRSSLPPAMPPRPRARPIASISSADQLGKVCQMTHHSVNPVTSIWGPHLTLDTPGCLYRIVTSLCSIKDIPRNLCYTPVSAHAAQTSA